jgi:hypothetical protein
MLCLWRPTFNHVRRSLDGFTSTIAPIRAAVRAPSRTKFFRKFFMISLLCTANRERRCVEPIPPMEMVRQSCGRSNGTDATRCFIRLAPVLPVNAAPHMERP